MNIMLRRKRFNHRYRITLGPTASYGKVATQNSDAQAFWIDRWRKMGWVECGLQGHRCKYRTKA